MYKNILICTDGSELAQAGVDQGLALAKALNARATVITATENYPVTTAAAAGAMWVPSTADIEGYEKAQKESAEAVLDKVKQAAASLGVAVSAVHVPDALPADAILAAAAQASCDLIVMSSHGRRGIRRLLLGSQAAEVLSRAAVPVLIIRQGDNA